jgi:hypothetical protein
MFEVRHSGDSYYRCKTWSATEPVMEKAAAQFNHDCHRSRCSTVSSSGLGRPPPTPDTNQAVLGTGTRAAASQIKADSKANANDQVMLFPMVEDREGAQNSI